MFLILIEQNDRLDFLNNMFLAINAFVLRFLAGKKLKARVTIISRYESVLDFVYCPKRNYIVSLRESFTPVYRKVGQTFKNKKLIIVLLLVHVLKSTANVRRTTIVHVTTPFMIFNVQSF